MSPRSRYTIQRLVARGGMAELYLATQHGAAGFERPIIIKRIRADFSADRQFRTMLIDEAHIAMSLNHGNVVQVLDLGTSNGHWFLVLELVDGWDVATLVRRGAAAAAPLPPPLALHIAADVCRALAFAHARSRDGQSLRIVHRDVSPENILVSTEGEVKLADFGIATAINKRDKTSAGVVKGKLGFMSPEQANGLPVDGRSDLYALGCSLYVMLTGVRPFRGRTDLEMLLRQQEGAYVPIDEVAPELPEPLRALVRRAMEKDPAARFADAAEMLAALETVQRTALTPAGQTELKGWLEELGQADSAPPTSRRPPPLRPPQTGTQVDEPELLDGAEVVLQEPVESGRVQAPVPPDEAPTQRQIPMPPDTVVAPPGGGSALLWTGLAALLLSAGVGAWWMVGPGRVLEPDAPPLDPPSDVDDGGPRNAPIGEAWVTVVPEEEEEEAAPAEEEEPAPPDGGTAAPPPDGGTAAAPPAPTGHDAGPPRVPASVSVKFTTEPSGADVMVNGRRFGSTPLNIRFKPGLMHDVTLHKDGFVDQQRRVYVSAVRGQVVSTTLQKAPPPVAKKKKWWPF